MSNRPPIVLYGVGDVAPRRPDLAGMFRNVSALLRSGDVVFGQLEAVVSDTGSRAPAAKLAMRTRREAAGAIRDAGFTHLSFASNHCLDWGEAALHDTLANVDAAGIGVCGAGTDLDAARCPAMVTVAGTRIAFLARCSILPQGYRAEPSRAGCAPLRAYTHYEQIEHDQPGTPCRVHTFAHRQDLAGLAEDVRAARSQADIVVLSMHWGLHFVPAEIADYQVEAARAAIEAGADVVLGHHPHILKGVDFHRGKPIFYSLGNFAIEQPWAFEEDVRETEGYRNLTRLSGGWDTRGEYMLPEDTRKSLIVRCDIDGGRIDRIRLVPVYLTTGSEPEPLGADDPRFAEVVDYLRTVSHSQGMCAAFTVRDGMLEVTDGS